MKSEVVYAKILCRKINNFSTLHIKLIGMLVLYSLLIACKRKKMDTQYSSYEVAGNSKITVVVDGLNVDSASIGNTVTDNTFYMELMTPHDTFFVKPIKSHISFPKLREPLSKAIIYYEDFKLEAPAVLFSHGGINAYYFPNYDSTTLYLDYYPFQMERAKHWKNINENLIYFEIHAKDKHKTYGVVNKIIQ